MGILDKELVDQGQQIAGASLCNSEFEDLLVRGRTFVWILNPEPYRMRLAGWLVGGRHRYSGAGACFLCRK